MLNEDGTPYLGDPRRALAAVCARYAALGLTPVVATELEFYLVDTTGEVPTPPRSPVTHKFLDGDGALSIDDLDHFEAFFTDVYAACDAHDVPVDSAISRERRRAVRDQPAARARSAEGGGRRACISSAS